MSNEELINVIEKCKILKSNYVYTFNNMIFGTDGNNIYFKRVLLDEQLPSVATGYKLTDIQNRIEAGMSLTEIIFDMNICRELCRKQSVVENLMMSSINLNRYTNIEKELDFNEYLQLKTSDGLKFIIRDKYVVPMYNGLLPIVKGDKVDLEVYDLDNYKFLAKFIIHKKKNLNVEVFILCMHMG